MAMRTTEVEEARTGKPAEVSFPLHEPVLPQWPLRFLATAFVLGCVLALLLAFAMHLAFLPLMSLAGGLVAVGFAWRHVRGERARALEAAQRIPHLALTAESLTLVEGDERRPLVRVDQRFGLTLLATPSRDELVLALTHRDGVEYVAARSPSGTRHLELLANAITTPVNDIPIGERIPMFGDGDRLLALVAELVARNPGALERVYLSDAGMADIVLEDRKLRAGQLDFDLRSPLRWRAYSFQEGSTIAAHSYQATQIRQGEREVVLVSLSPTGELATPSIVSPPPGGHVGGPLASTEVQRALARDLRLAHCLADLPPPRAHRIAIDRLFMPRIRTALDLAPSDVAISPAHRPAPPVPELLHTPPEGIEHLRQSRP